MVSFSPTSISGWMNIIFVLVAASFITFLVCDGMLKFSKVEEAVEIIQDGKVDITTSGTLKTFLGKKGKYEQYDEYATEAKITKPKVGAGASVTNAARWTGLATAIILLHLLIILYAFKSSPGVTVTPSKASKRR